MLRGRDSNMQKGEITRQRIVELAAPIFNRRGFAGCSIQDVMDATGLEKGGIYRHFSSKEELAAEAFRYAVGNSARIRTEGLDPALSSLEKLRIVVRQFVESPSPTPGGCPIMNTAIDSDDGNPCLRRLAVEAVSEWRARLATIVEEGIRRREIRRSTDPRQIANAMISALEGALMVSRLEGSKIALRDAQALLEVAFKQIASSDKT
jgi:TetR/AcrR family transcriptional regulator, transcriptional repressor for nem operon